MKKKLTAIIFLTCIPLLVLGLYLTKIALDNNEAEEHESNTYETVRFEKKDSLYEPGSVYIYQKLYPTHVEGTRIDNTDDLYYWFNIYVLFVIEKQGLGDFVELIKNRESITLLNFRDQFSRTPEEQNDTKILGITLEVGLGISKKADNNVSQPLGQRIIRMMENSLEVNYLNQDNGILLLEKPSDDFIEEAKDKYGIKITEYTSFRRRFCDFNETTKFSEKKKFNIGNYYFEIYKMTSDRNNKFVQIYSPNFGCVAVLGTPKSAFQRPHDHHEDFPGYTSMSELCLFIPPTHYEHELFYNEDLVLFEDGKFYPIKIE